MTARRFLLLILLLKTSAVFSQTYSKTQLISGLPWGIAFDFAPDGRIFATKKGGWSPQAVDASIKVFDANGNFLNEFYDLSDSITCSNEYGLIGITLDPNFAVNHFLYCYYTFSSDPANGGDIHLRVQRFTEQNNSGTQPVILLDLDVADSTRNHVGGSIHFRPSDSTHIYVAVGDMLSGDMGFYKAAQTDNPLGKILRISKYPGAPPPSDNPFYDDGDPLSGNCDYIWAYGFRNPFDFCFGPNDSLYATDNGTSNYDEVNLVTRGGFYGWPYCEGNYDRDTITLPCHEANSIAPLITYPFPVPALTGIIFYTDTVFNLQQNHLIVGDFNHADLQDIALGNAPVYNSIDSANFWIDESNVNGITCIRQGPEGCIYVMEIGDTASGGIYMICPDANGISEPGIKLDMRVGPNPCNGDLNIVYDLPHPGSVQIELTDVTGRVVVSFANENQTGGLHSSTLQLAEYGLNSGCYFVSLFFESAIAVKPVLIDND